MDNPMEQIRGDESSSSSSSSSRRNGAKQTTPQREVEMVEVNVALKAAPPSRKAKRRSYEARQAALKNVNERRRKGRTANNPALRPPSDADAGAFFRASHAYVAEADDEIDLLEGDQIDQMEDLGGGWWHGRNVRSGEVGAFPASFVE